MEAMQNLSNREPSSVRKMLAALTAGAVMCIGAPVALANPTVVTPAGDQYSATLTSGTNAVFKLGTATVTCTHSTTGGAVPASPSNSGDPVGPTPVTTPTFTSCSASIGSFGGLTATVTTSGSWSISLDEQASSIAGTLTIPQNGVNVTVSIPILGVTCMAEVAPTGPLSVTGTWTNASGTVKPRLAFTNTSVTVKPSGGFGCPTGTTATMSVSYDISDTTTPSNNINVAP